MDADTKMRQTQWSALYWMRNHELRGEAYWDEGRGARWYIGEPGTFIHSCEIIAGVGGSLIVHGDWEPARFAHDFSDAWSRLRWMADCRDVGYYVMQKARIGGQTDHAYDSEVALNDLRCYTRDLVDEWRHWEASEHRRKLISVIREARFHTETEHELRQFLYENDEGWDLWEHSFGRVAPSHVVVSHIALNRLASLLRERYGNAGPPQCRELKAVADG